MLVDKMPVFDTIQRALVKAGAVGSIESLRFAFGAQLNPELTSLDSVSIASHIKAFVILSDWLKEQILVDKTRKLTFFAADFPVAYQKKIVDPNYRPSMDQLIDDYLADNPTRNRSLDMLPAFCFIDEQRVRKVVEDPRVKARPTFHYRLPNCQLNLPSWSIAIEWYRWLLVEKLAHSEDLLEEMAEWHARKIDDPSTIIDNRWRIELNNYAERIRVCDR